MNMWNALCVAGVLLATMEQVSAGDQDFTLDNKTGVIINSLYVTPSATSNWGEDILGAETLSNNHSTNIDFSPGSKAKLWDLRIEDIEGNSITWNKLNLLEISKVTLFYNQNTRQATAKEE